MSVNKTPDLTQDQMRDAIRKSLGFEKFVIVGVDETQNMGTFIFGTDKIGGIGLLVTAKEVLIKSLNLLRDNTGWINPNLKKQ